MDANTPLIRRAAETEKLIAFLRKVEPEQIATYAELRTAGGFYDNDTESRVKGLIRTAVSALLREDAVVFLSVRGIGLKRASAVEIAESGVDTVKRARRMCAKSMKRIATIDPKTLPETQRTTYITSTAQLAALAHIASRPIQHRIEQTAMRSTQTLDLNATLELVRNK